MSHRDEFRSRLEEVCGEEGWGVAPGRVEIKFEGGRRQIVNLQDFEFEGSELVRLYSVIGNATRIEAARLTQALRVSFGLPHGALALNDDELVIVDTLAARDADPGEIRAVLRYLAETADHLERTMFGVDEN